jgi:hypothetical protein
LLSYLAQNISVLLLIKGIPDILRPGVKISVLSLALYDSFVLAFDPGQAIAFAKSEL